MHRAWLFVLLAGCDAVYGLDGRGDMQDLFDSDGDGKRDGVDPCPHIADEIARDDDRDGISTDCDPDDAVSSTRVFLTFTNGALGDLSAAGTVRPDGDAIQLGTSDDGLQTLVYAADATWVTVDVAYEILETSIEQTPPSGAWSEVGLYTAHRSFVAMERGNNCFLGIDPERESYLEFNEDAASIDGTLEFGGPLAGTRGRFRQNRTPIVVHCAVIRDDNTFQNGYDVRDLGTTSGAIALSTERLLVRIDSVWIAYH